MITVGAWRPGGGDGAAMQRGAEPGHGDEDAQAGPPGETYLPAQAGVALARATASATGTANSAGSDVPAVTPMT